MSFRLFGFDVEVRLSFLLSAVLLSIGVNFDRLFHAQTLKSLSIWIPTLFVSILIHELGHAFAIRWQKLPAEIQIHGMGGTTTWRELLPISRGGRIIISLAGPLAGFAFGFLVYGVGQLCALVGYPLVFHAMGGGLFGSIVGYPLGLPGLAYVDLIYINFIWGAVNLLPVLPFDGGHVLQHALGNARLRITLVLSAMVGGAVCIYFLSQKMLWAAYLFGSSAATSVVALGRFLPVRRQKAPPPPSDAAVTLTRAQNAVDDDRPADAIALAKEVLAARPSTDDRAKALTITVWAHLMGGDEKAARRAHDDLASFSEPDPALSGNLALAEGKLAEARALLERAYMNGDRRKEVFGALIQALLRLDAFEAAAKIAVDRIDGLNAEDCRKIAELAAEGGAKRDAAKLLERLAERERNPDDYLAAIRAWVRAGDRRRATNLTDSPALRGTPAERSLRDDAELAGLLEPSSAGGAAT